METKTYTTIDRAGWPAGEWDEEPDKVQWQDAETGLPCLAKRHPSLGHWCGYVGVPAGHWAHGKGYDDVSVDVHGGLTYADTCQAGADEATAICHVPAPGEPDHVWWLGFDCAHAWDASPYDYLRAQKGGIWAMSSDDKYRTLDYVQRQCAHLAAQLARPEPDEAAQDYRERVRELA